MGKIYGRCYKLVLRYLQSNQPTQNIYGCVLDSPYCNLERLAKEIGSNITGLPQFIVGGLVGLLRNKILQEQKFDIQELELVSKINLIKCPLMFITALKDSLVSSSHTDELFNNFKGKKSIQYAEGDHNSCRADSVIEMGIKHLQQCVQRKKKKIFESYCHTTKHLISQKTIKTSLQAIKDPIFPDTLKNLKQMKFKYVEKENINKNSLANFFLNKNKKIHQI